MFNDFLHLIFPNTCELCYRNLTKRETYICIRCRYHLPRCDLSLIDEEIYRHFIEIDHFSHFYAYLKFYKKGITQKLLHNIKYQNKPHLAEKVGEWLGKEINYDLKNEKVEMIIPVPLHPKKKKKRGYNQSEYFAVGLSSSLNIPCSIDTLVRITNNETQTNKSREERIWNVKNIFSVKDRDNIVNKNILLVDDVITTGATLESCALELVKSGAGKISVAAIALAK